MKTNKKLLVVVFMLGTLFNYANNNDKIFNKTVNADKVKIAFKNVKKGHLLTIKDDKGIQLHKETVSKKGLLTKIFDLSSLNDGMYTIELNKDYEIIVRSLEVKNNKVIFKEDSKNVIFKPVIRTDDNIVMISKLGFKKEPTKIALYFEHEEIYSETVNNEVILNRIYKLDKEIKGDYKVVINNNDRNYSYNFEI